MLLGSHLSIAGGLDKALLSGAEYGFQAVGMFVRNQLQWRAPRLDEQAVGTFRRTRRRLGIRAVVAHASYLVNLAGRADIRARSIAAMIEDLRRCARLGIEYLVLHPGSNPDCTKGIGLIAAALNDIASATPRARPRILLETTAGQGNCIGHRFGQLGEILARLERPDRFGVCLDTCHVFAAGYDLRGPRAYAGTIAGFDREIGLAKLKAIHLNDSKHGLGSRVDRHAHIGHGRLGRRAFAHIVNDLHLADVPMILETPKEKDGKGRDWDAINARTLRRLVRGK